MVGNRVAQAKWTSPVNNRLLLEGGFGMYFSRYGGGQIPGLETEHLIRITEQCATGCADNGNTKNSKVNADRGFIAPPMISRCLELPRPLF